MLVEEFQDACLVHGHLWYVNRVILAILSLYVACGIPPRFCSKEYMDWKRFCLKNNNMTVKFLVTFDFWMKWFYFLLSLHVAWCFPSGFCSREYKGWKKLFEKFQEGCLVHDHLWYLSGMKEAFGLTNPIKFLLIRTYSLEEEVVWRILRWLLSGWPSLMSEWNDLSNNGSPFCLEDSHQFSAQEKIGVWRCCLKNSKMAV